MKKTIARTAPAFFLTAALAGCGGGEKAAPTPPEMAQCVACHSFGKDGPRRSGPNLHGMFGKPAASAPGFQYSAALKKSGIVWTETALYAYLAAPGKSVPGTRMTFSGEPDPAKRQKMIAYLRAQGGPK